MAAAATHTRSMFVYYSILKLPSCATVRTAFIPQNTWHGPLNDRTDIDDEDDKEEEEEEKEDIDDVIFALSRRAIRFTR